MTKNFCTFAVQNPRKDAGVVDRDGLENRCTLTGTQGSNPCLSAKKSSLQGLLFLHPERRDENPGGVRYRAALCEAETPCLSAKKQPSRLLFCIWKDGMRTLEGSLPRSALRSRDSLSFRKKAALKAAFFGSSRKFGAFVQHMLTYNPLSSRDMPLACESGMC